MENATIDLTQIEINFQERTQMRAQQSMSRTEAFITYMGGKGRENKVTFWGGNNLQQKTQRHEKIPVSQTKREAYWFGSASFWGKELLDGDDELYEATDSSSGLSDVWAAAASREKDRVHINAAMGAAYKGRFGQSNAEPLPAAQIIPHGNVGLTPGKIQLGVQMIRRAHPEEIDPICLFLTGKQLYGDLMGENTVTSRDYQMDSPLKDLNLPYHFGCHYKVIEDYANFNPDDNGAVVKWDPILKIKENGISSGTHIRYLVMWVKSAMKGKKELPITTRIFDESKDYGEGAKSLKCEFKENSTRVNPLGVVVIEVADTSVLTIAKS